MSGSTVVTQTHVALTPDERSMTGHLWNQKPFLMSEDWEVHVRFVIGKQGSVGADGLAFWYTTSPGLDGTAFGNTDKFEGLGVMFDTFDNDGSGDHPLVYAVVGDGITPYDGASDGGDKRRGSCTSRFRTSKYNSHKNPTHVMIRYVGGILSVDIDINQDPDTIAFSRCFEAPVSLKRSGYFGLTAATGGVTDHHDVISFSVYSFPVNRNRNNYEEQRQQRAPEEPKYQSNTATEQRPNNHFTSSQDTFKSEQKIGNFIREAQDRQSRFSTSLYNQFSILTDKFRQTEKVTDDSLQTVEEAVTKLSSKLSKGKQAAETLKTDIATLTELSTSLRDTAEILIQETNAILKRHQDMAGSDDLRSAQFSQTLEGHSFGFWLLFGLFQVFFVATVFYWNQSKKASRFD